MSIEKLQVIYKRKQICIAKKNNITLMKTNQVHFRAGIGGDGQISETAAGIIQDIDELHSEIKAKTNSLEQTLSQLEIYQRQMQSLRQKIMHEEQQLRLVLAPTYLPHDRDKAVTEQQVGANV